ncbi:MAG TPA: SusD/RagB family nutrient-binding outer membrane lipoprotein, partial [Chryseolinea sp.]|nr:SusD/RagB family nutrient-binding outer membrane lipoprotein [Chryseolinea sp.]
AEAEAGAFESNADNATIAYLGSSPNTNPIWLDLVQSGRADYVIANTIVDKLLDLSDPRLAVYADETEDGDFIGGEYGTANTYSANSHVGALYHEPDLEGVILDYAEVQFLLAEAAARGFATSESVETYYENGIRASMEYWGIDDAEIDAYLAQPSVAYATAAGDWKQKIGTQEWIALYNRGFEGWTVWRRLDFEGFNIPDGLEESDIPRRLIFPIEEATLNPSSWKQAIDMIGGSDDVQTTVFWDVN